MFLFLDMDGVLADFDAAVHKHMGLPPSEIDDEIMTREIVGIPDFWLDIPPMPEMLEIWDYTKRLNPFILTATANWDLERCRTSKPLWIQKHLPDFPISRLILCRRSEKKDHANYSTGSNVLLDDYHKNILDWEKAGGFGILHKHWVHSKEILGAAFYLE